MHGRDLVFFIPLASSGRPRLMKPDDLDQNFGVRISIYHLWLEIHPSNVLSYVCRLCISPALPRSRRTQEPTTLRAFQEGGSS
jgi:hypothetical protein